MEDDQRTKDESSLTEVLADLRDLLITKKIDVGSFDDSESDAMRLDDLSQRHHLPFKIKGDAYIFEDFVAHGLSQALGYAEGYDRAVANHKEGKAEDV